MKISALLLPVLVPGALLAQPGPWRVSLQGGVARTYNHFQTDRPLPENRFRFSNRIGVAAQLGLERSLTPRFSLRAGLGVLNLAQGTEEHYQLRDTVSGVAVLGSGRSGSGFGVLMPSLGVGFNSRAYGRFVFTAGTDLVLRASLRGDESGRRFGGSGGIRFGSDRKESTYLFRLQSVPPVTFGVAFRAGLDYRLSERAMLALTAQYHLGLGDLRRAVSDTLRFDGVDYAGTYRIQGSHVGVLVGLKYNLFRANPLSSLTYTPYNGPLRRVGYETDERTRTYRRGTWLVGVGGSGAATFSRFARHLYGLRAGYFGLDRTLVGLKANYLREAHSCGGQWLVAGPLLRHQFTASRVSPFIELAYLWGGAWANDRWPGTPNPSIRYASCAPGLAIRLGPYLRVDASLELLSRGSYGPRNGSSFLQFGLSHQFGTPRP